MKKKESKETKFGDQMMIELAYQHVLQHSAHSFILGTFGGVSGRNFICIQSLDGLLSFYEQESFAFQIYLPSFMLPSTFTYLDKTDSFLFLNGFLIFDCYSYEALASAASSNDKKITKTWEYNLGEGILDIKTIRKDGLVIIVLSERNLFGLNEHGNMIFMKRLEYKPVAICCYITEESKKLMMMIATDSHCLNLYEEMNLKWSMKIDLLPVSVNRFFSSNLPGGIVLLSEDGFLQCVYIGTHPSVYLVPPLVEPEINFQEAESELKQLQQKIADNDLVDPLSPDLLTVELKIDKTLKIEDDVRKCNVIVEINPQCLISKIQVLVVVEPPLATTEASFVVANCCEKTFVESCVYLSRPGVVSCLDVRVAISYITNEGVARILQKTGTLPLGLVVTEANPIKEAQHKITIATNKSVCGMNQLFREFSIEETSTNVVGFKFLNSEEVVTVLAAKSSQRYRLQSDSLAAISLLLSSLVERLQIHFRKDSSFSLVYSTPLPLEVYFEKVGNHHKLITKKKQLEEKLSKETAQFRTIQKKILTNLKDVTPKPTSNLHRILKDTFQMVLSSIDALEGIEEELFLSRCGLSSLSRLLISLLQLMAVGEEDLRLLRIVFNPHMHDTDDQGWLEVQEATSSFLLRTILAKSTKDQQKPTEILLEPMSDTSKLVKHLSSVIERVTKGTYLLERNEFESKKEVLTTIQGGYESEESLFEDAIPVGSKYVDLTNVKEEQKEVELPQRDAVDLHSIPVEEKQEESEITEKTNVEDGEKAVEKPLTEIPERESPVESKQADDDSDDAIWDVKIEEMRI